MATPTNLSPDQFIEEIKEWGASSKSLIKVRRMLKGKFVYCRVTLPNNGEVLQTRILETKFKDFHFMNIDAVPAVWEDETEIIKNLSKKFEESINANTNHIPSNPYKNIRF